MKVMHQSQSPRSRNVFPQAAGKSCNDAKKSLSTLAHCSNGYTYSMTKMSLWVLCESCNKKRRTACSMVLCRVCYLPAAVTDNAARIAIHILGKCVGPFLDTTTADTAFDSDGHVTVVTPMEHCSSPAVCLCTHCLEPLVHGRYGYE